MRQGRADQDPSPPLIEDDQLVEYRYQGCRFQIRVPGAVRGPENRVWEVNVDGVRTYAILPEDRAEYERIRGALTLPLSVPRKIKKAIAACVHTPS